MTPRFALNDVSVDEGRGSRRRDAVPTEAPGSGRQEDTEEQDEAQSRPAVMRFGHSSAVDRPKSARRARCGRLEVQAEREANESVARMGGTLRGCERHMESSCS